MKRMTLLTGLALVFSLFTVTAAIAGPGPGAGQAEQAGDTLTTQTRANDATCQGDDCPAGDMVRTQDRVQDQVGECQSDDCPNGEPTKTQAQTQSRTQTKSGECQGDDCRTDEPIMTQLQTRERLTERLVAMLGAGNADVEAQYRLFLDLMLQNMFRLGAIFI